MRKTSLIKLQCLTGLKQANTKTGCRLEIPDVETDDIGLARDGGFQNQFIPSVLQAGTIRKSRLYLHCRNQQ